jgi:hypothetical protein
MIFRRPKPATGPHEIVGVKPSFAACGKIPAMSNQPVLSATSGKVSYSPSGRKVALLIAFLLMLPWICFKKSNTYDETVHMLALCGSGLFVLFAGHSFGPLESIKFIRKETGADGAILNMSDVPAHAICEKLNEWQERYSKDDAGDRADCT